MRHWVIVLAATGIMLLGFLASMTMLGDQTRLKQLLISHVESQTGRQLSIDGVVSVRFFPRFRIEAERIRLAGPSDFAGPELVSSDSLTVDVRLLPLIRGRIETREMVLDGARLNLAVDESGLHTLAGLMRRPGRDGAPGISASGPLRLEDVEINLGGLQLGAIEQIQVDRVELDGLVFDRALNLDFRGAVGRPAIIRDVVVNGVLFVPAETGQFRLADMRFTGRHADGGAPFELVGAMSFSAIPPLSMALDQGRFSVNAQQLQVQASYEGRSRPYFSVTASAETLDAKALLGAFPPATTEHWASSLANWVAVHDFDLDLSVQQLWIGPQALPDVRLSVRAAEGHARLDLAEVSLPGALLRGEGEVSTGAEETRIDGLVRLDVDDLAALLSGSGVGWAVEGAGQVQIVPGSMMDSEALAEAHLQFFDGRLPVLEVLRQLAGLDPHDRFDTLQGRLLVYPDASFFPSVTIRDESSEVRLQGILLSRSGRLSGTAVVQSATESRQFELRGSTAKPEIVAASSASPGQ